MQVRGRSIWIAGIVILLLVFAAMGMGTLTMAANQPTSLIPGETFYVASFQDWFRPFTRVTFPANGETRAGENCMVQPVLGLPNVRTVLCSGVLVGSLEYANGQYGRFTPRYLSFLFQRSLW